MSKKKIPLPKIQVIMDYKTLQELLACCYEVDSLREDNRQLRQQMAALRSQFTELMELYRQYQD